MKFLILVCALISVLAYAEDDINMKDPNIDLYKGEMAASVVDVAGAHEGIIRESYKIPVAKSCPGCNLHGNLDLVDENGTPVTAGDGSKVRTGNESENTIGQ